MMRRARALCFLLTFVLGQPCPTNHFAIGAGESVSRTETYPRTAVGAYAQDSTEVSVQEKGTSEDPTDIREGISGDDSVLQSPTLAITDHKMSPGPIPAGCASPTRRFDFAPTEPIAYQWTAAAGARAGDLVRWDWIRPDGTPFRSDQLTFSVSGNVCFSAGLFIAGQAPATLLGEWKVNIFYNGARVLIENFTIGDRGPRLCTRSMEGLYDGAFRLGSAIARATCFGMRMLDAPTVAQITDDLTHTAAGMEIASPCLPVDLSRISGLQSRLNGLTGQQAVTELNLVVQDVVRALGRVSFRSDFVGSDAVAGMLQAALNVGMAVGNATCFSCPDPLPQPAISAINSALSNAETSLRPYASCVPGFNFPMFRDRRIGTPVSALQSLGDLTALSEALQAAICNSDCCFSCTVAAPAPLGSVQGTVRNASNNQPIPGATVSVAGGNLSATSGSDGAYSISNVPAGQQTLNGSAAGFLPAQVAVTIVANQTVTQNILLTPVPATGTIQGTVRNASSNQPIAGATIAVANTNVTTISGSDGAYALTNVPTGQQTLNASASGYMSAQVMVTVAANQTVMQNILLTPIQTGTVQGTVRNAMNGQPISGATISVAGAGGSTNSGNDGTYTLTNAPVGQQTLNASASGFISTQVMITVVAGQAITQNISLSPILTGGEIRITLNWTKDASGAPDDLDMHLAGPNPDGFSCFEIFFLELGSLTSAPFAMLEVDNIELAGHPPTETVRISRLTPGIYRFYVDNFAAERIDGISRSRATVQVFGTSGLLFSATAPSGPGYFWNVFTLNGQTGAITPVNQYSIFPPSTSPCR